MVVKMWLDECLLIFVGEPRNVRAKHSLLKALRQEEV